MNHNERQAKGRTYNDGPNITDQSQAQDTDINVILKKYGVTGVARGTTNAPEYLDHTELPQDLRQALDMAHRAQDLQKSLPPQLRDKTLEELTRLTHTEIQTILTPPAAPPDKPKDEPK